ncbi:UDP-N-acetylmuramate dehydrogenase [Porphyromonas pogonae]|uniref:UDP-N-acetylmuramate dehydrogenase n=1 Tax=Porphyromonas pogonae TaxID=867595 RepID=UPI002E774D4A|nr:UDP-N-acetylmuramate dehydrogenase [Porphyromonas pogonae]
MEIKQSFLLSDYNTFKIPATTDYWVTYDSIKDLELLISDEFFQESRSLHIGEGSNLLFLANFHGIILFSRIDSIEEISRTSSDITLMVGAGMNWDKFVEYTVQHGYYGIENLSLIPGQVGSSAIQNIGAYGVEASQYITAVHAIDKRNGEKRRFENRECDYSYRHSIFKEPEYDKYIVTHVEYTLKLVPELNLSYKDLSSYFEASAETPSLEKVREAVIKIRQSKLPDTEILGNAGSFFMNPIITSDEFAKLQLKYPHIPHYVMEGGLVKVPAGWLIDQCGFKGHQDGHAGVYEKQALVLVNLDGKATGNDIANLAEKIKGEVKSKFDITIEPEVKYIF